VRKAPSYAPSGESDTRKYPLRTLTTDDVCAAAVGHVSSIGSPMRPNVDPLPAGLGVVPVGLKACMGE
jgi:hypothetical protein